MSIHDYRRKDATQWTYYVVDHLTTMANVYRFDTPDAAIACYKGLDPSLRSAIGSSFCGVHELDHIHRCTNDLSILVTSADSIETPLWRDSPEIQSAIDKMISALHVQHERNNTIINREEMFSSLVNFQDQAFAEAHQTLFYADPNKPGKEQYTLFAVLNHDIRNKDPFNYRQQQFQDDTEFQAFISFLKENSVFESDYHPTGEIIILSTCNNAFGENNRLLICAGRNQE